jgi:hypothetical protein
MSAVRELGTTDGRKFEYGFARVKDLSVHARKLEPVNPDKVPARVPKTAVDFIEVNGEKIAPSKRFWTSLQCRFGFSANVFRYFDHAEVFNRVSERARDDKVRFCIERSDSKTTPRLLAVTNPGASTIRYDQLQELLGKYKNEGVSYADGIVRSTHKPRVGDGEFKIAGDGFMNQFVIDTPIDGFGKPNIYLSLLRLICSNGAIGFGKAFRSELNTGKNDQDGQFALIRAMDGFNNEEGFAAMRQRFDGATRSWASVNEVQRLYNILLARAHRGELKKTGVEVVNGQTFETSMPILNAFHKMTGDVAQIYGLSNLDSLSVKRQRTLPTSCKVYDLLNFATEVATHNANAHGGRALQAHVGELISNEFDLENTVDQFSDWRDFFIGNENTADTMRVLQSKHLG